MDVLRESDKFSMPVLPSTIVHREALTRALATAIGPRNSSHSTPYKLVLLCAPAGYGKTTLLIDTASQLSSVCCWYILDETDADPAIFLRRLFISIQRGFPELGARFASLLETSISSIGNNSGEWTALFDALLDTLKNDISRPFVLIFCNFHEVARNETINKCVERLIAELPHEGVLVLESRAIPALTLAPLIARRQMFGLGNQELRFTSQEVYELACLQNISAFSFEEADQLTTMFEGWIAGILLGSRLGYAQFQPGAEPWNEPIPGGTYSPILAYIVNEVFKDETSTYEFLQQTAIFDRLTPDYCNALLEISDAARRLAYAEQRGLFVVRDRENANVRQAKDYLCHSALRQLLAEHLRQQSPESYRALHQRAARILRADHHYWQALIHACQAEEYHLAASILLEGTTSHGYEEHTDLILRCLKPFPEAIVKQHPRLLLISSFIHLRRGEFALVPPLLERVEAFLDTPPMEENQREQSMLQAELCIARGHFFFFQGAYQSTQKLCQQALSLLPPDERRLHIRAYQYLGISLIVGTGQVQEGIVQLQHALHMSKSQQNERQTATLHRLIANAYGWIGNNALAEYHQTRAYQIWQKLNSPEEIIYGLTSMGLLKMRQGLVQQAEELLQRALNLARGTAHFKSGEAYALVALGDLYNNLGRYTEALNYLEDGLNLAYECEDRYLICCSLCYLALAHIFLDDAPTAHFLLDQVALRSEERQSFEGCLFSLTQGTVYLLQQDYRHAESFLEDAENTARRTGIQILHIKALLCLVVCYLRQNKRRASWQVGQHIMKLNKKGDFDFLLQVSFSRYSELAAFLKETPETDLAKDEAVPAEPVAPKPAVSSEAALEVAQSGQEIFAFQILALGEPQVFCRGVPVTHWRMARALELFFFLLERGRPTRKDQIIAAIWPDEDSEQIDSTVRTTIYYLRKALGQNSIIFRSGLYSLQLAEAGGGSIWYDVEIFNEHYRRAKKALEHEDDTTAAAAFNTMVDLYTGDYLEPFYNDWCIFRRDQLRQACIDAHHQLALIAWRRKDWDESVHHWQRLLTVDACSEEAHEGIMRCYLQQGKRELALRQFQACNQVLWEELQVRPGAALQKLYRIIAGA
jgi:LuxR family maltose regulon positive regulatory protein